MPGLLRGVARTAVIAGTASATAGAVRRRQMSKDMEAYDKAEQKVYGQQPQQAYEQPPQQFQQMPPPAQAAAPAEGMDDKLAQLERLGQLKAQGILSEQEFEQQKAQILG